MSVSDWCDGTPGPPAATPNVMAGAPDRDDEQVCLVKYNGQRETGECEPVLDA